MPFGSEGVEAGLGLALSEGGFRATLVHIGSCCRLIELGSAKDPTTKSYQDLVVAPLGEFCGMQIGTLRTRLNPFDDTEQEQLITGDARSATPPHESTRPKSSKRKASQHGHARVTR